MKSFAKNGVSSSFTYDADGLRSSKTVGTRKTEYQYVGDKLFYEKRGDNQTFYYFYDSYGNLSMIRYTLVGSDNSVSTATYLAQTNSQGDVVALYTKAGALYARYEYDAWGNTLSVTDANGNEITAWYNIANANPIRYRGYYFDADLNLYYLQSRYYDSEIGRFINADGYITTGQGVMSYNMYSYCQNNPVMYSDPKGTDVEDILNWFSDVVTFIYETALSASKASSTQVLTQATIVNSKSPSASIAKFATAVAYLSIFLENINDAKERVENDEKTSKILWDLAWDTGADIVAYSVGATIGANIGTFLGGTIGTALCPALGTAGGAIVGRVVGTVIGTFVAMGVTAISEHILEKPKNMIKEVYQ